MAENFEISTNEINNNKRSALNYKMIFKVTKGLICVLLLCGLIYQGYKLIDQYVGYRTVVNVRFETLKYNRLPAITICYPRAISMDKMVERFPNLTSNFEEYKTILKNVTENDYQNKTLRKYLNGIYKKFGDETDGEIDLRSLTFGELHDLSIDFINPKNRSYFATESAYYAILLNVNGIRLYDNKSTEVFTFQDKYPITSILYGWDPIQSQKCFTFNSHLNKDNIDYRMDISSIWIEVRIGPTEWGPIE